MNSQRSFARNLTGVGSAADNRRAVSYHVKEYTQQSKSKPVEPVDYETYLIRNKSTIHNDPNRELLRFPHDALSDSTIQRSLRTAHSSVPPRATGSVSHLLTKECIKTYTTDWTTVDNKYDRYSSTYHQLLPNEKENVDKLKGQVFESDMDDSNEDALPSKNTESNITKQGWLYKGPDSGNDSNPSFINVSKSYKKRYFYLKKYEDKTYYLEFHKDDKKSDAKEAKGNVFLDSLVSVVASKRGRHAFELKMQGDKYYVLAAECEAEQKDWIQTIKTILNAADNVSHRSLRMDDDNVSLNGGRDEDPTRYLLSKEPNDMMRYPDRDCVETDICLNKKRQENRCALFNVYTPTLKKLSDRDTTPQVDVYTEKFPIRFTVSLQKLIFKLQADVNSDVGKEKLDNPEPFFLTFALYDTKTGRKITENVYLDCNSDTVYDMIPPELTTPNGIHPQAKITTPHMWVKNDKWLSQPGKLLFSCTSLHSEVYLHITIDKVLQGPINTAVEPYLRGPEAKSASKQHRLMKQYCQSIGHHKMPFGWAARPICRAKSLIDETGGTLPVYKQDSSKLEEDDIIKHLMDISRPDKISKWCSIPATLQVNVEHFDPKQLVQDAEEFGVLTPSLDVVHPLTMDRLPVLEVEQFPDSTPHNSEPFYVYRNNVYLYPMSVKFDNVKHTKARNISCCLEIKDSDDENSTPLCIIHSRPRTPVFSTSANCSVLHHNTSPEWSNEIKACLPFELTERHHILITFYHVACESSIKNRQSIRGSVTSVDTVIGYAWLPICRTKRLNSGEHLLPVSSSLPAGYLSSECSNIKWLDSGKGLFKIKLKVSSTVYTDDKHLHDFFTAAQKVRSTPNSVTEQDTKDRLKGLHAADKNTFINFLPTLLNQLFSILVSTNNEDVAYESVRVITHAVNITCGLRKEGLLRTYIKYVFNTMSLSDTSQPHKTIHEELVKNLTHLMMNKTNSFTHVNDFLKYSWFFFDLITKSVLQYLLHTGRIKKARHERFPVTKDSSYVTRLETFIGLVVSKIFDTRAESPNETKSANAALAHFLKTMFTTMDRGSVFKLVNSYMEKFRPGDPKQLHEFKYEFIKIVCSHEHYVQLCLPTLRPGYVKNRGGLSGAGSRADSRQDFTLSEEYRHKHVLSGILLQEVMSGLNEIRDIRKLAIKTLRDQLAKHAFDDRYQKPALMGRIVSLYLPLFNILLENKNRLLPKDNKKSAAQTPGSNRNSVLISTESGDGLPTLVDLAPSYNKSGSLPNYSSRASVISESPSTVGSMLSVKENGSYLDMIAGSRPAENKAGNNSPRVVQLKHLKGSENDLSTSRTSLGSDDSTSTIDAKDSISLAGAPNTRGSSVAAGKTSNVRYDKLDSEEIKDLLMCFMFIVRNLPDDILIQWMLDCKESEIVDFFSLFEICLNQFKYMGKKKYQNMSLISGLNSRKSSASVPSRRSELGKHLRQSSGFSELEDLNKISAAFPEQYLFDGNLVSEVGLIILDTLALYTQNISFKKQLEGNKGENDLMKKIFDLHLSFIDQNQSQIALEHCFALIRLFINKFDEVLFRGKATFCGSLCYSLLRCCNSHLPPIRKEACITSYHLMKANYKKNEKKNFTRVKLQMMKSVSKLINDNSRVTGSRFKESLAVINSFASSDRSMRNTKLSEEVKELMRSIRRIIMATDKMKDYERDPEKSIDLKYNLAREYINSPELRTTWLESMADYHVERRNYSEAAHCYLHIAGAVAEFLKQMEPGSYVGCRVLSKLSHNIERDETNHIDDRAVIEELQYNEDTLVERLEKAAGYLSDAERYEAMGELYRIVIPIYEKKRDLQSLAECYKKLHESYSKALDFSKSGKRILGSYFRVTFFGVGFEDDDGKEFIYKEPKLTILPEICERLRSLYGDQTRIIQDSKQVNRSDLDPQVSQIQVTYVVPYFTEKELQKRLTDYERNDNVNTFVFSTPFTKSGKSHGGVTEQWTRKTVLHTKESFPYVKKRIEVVKKTDKDFSPIEVATDEMKNKLSELESAVNSPIPDLKKLQLKLQGAVSAQVNAGPISYAEAFLTSGAASKLKLSSIHVNTLKEYFREFMLTCRRALDLNGDMIQDDQKEYQASLRASFTTMSEKLQEILNEKIL